jgi:N-acetylmuramoyl-L-alanine amidase
MREGKQSPQVPPGIYEGVFNRVVCELVRTELHSMDIECEMVVRGPLNPTIADRVAYSNELHAVLGNCHHLCVHANADGHSEWTKAKGCTVFYYPGSKTGAEMSRVIHDSIVRNTIMSPRGIKEKKLGELAKTAMPAAYIECGFMTNKAEAAYMASSTGQHEIADSIVEAIEYFEGM